MKSLSTPPPSFYLLTPGYPDIKTVLEKGPWSSYFLLELYWPRAGHAVAQNEDHDDPDIVDTHDWYLRLGSKKRLVSQDRCGGGRLAWWRRGCSSGLESAGSECHRGGGRTPAVEAAPQILTSQKPAKKGAPVNIVTFTVLVLVCNIAWKTQTNNIVLPWFIIWQKWNTTLWNLPGWKLFFILSWMIKSFRMLPQESPSFKMHTSLP